MVSKLNIYNVNLKHFGETNIPNPLNQYIFNLKFNQDLLVNSCKLEWKMSKFKHQKQH